MEISRESFLKVIGAVIGVAVVLPACGGADAASAGASGSGGASGASAIRGGGNGGGGTDGAGAGGDEGEAAASGAGGITEPAEGGAGDGSTHCGGGSLTNSVMNNHPTPHVLNVPLADAMSTVTITYTLGPGGQLPMLHTHSLSVTASEFAILRSTGTVTTMSSNTVGHSHPVVLTCDA